MPISREELLKGQPCPPELEANLSNLIEALNQFRSEYGQAMIVTSGYRTPEYNHQVGGKPGSAHLSCQAADFSDPDGTLKSFCLKNIPLLEDCGLWMEAPSYTPTWVHLQIRPAHIRIFIP